MKKIFLLTIFVLAVILCFSQFLLAQDVELLDDINKEKYALEVFDSVNGIEVNGQFIFSAYNLESGLELWVTNGTQNGSKLLKDIIPGSEGSYPRNFAVIGTLAFFIAEHSSLGTQIWVTNGTEVGTDLLSNIVATPSFTSPDNLMVVEGNSGFMLLFVATSPTLGREIHIYDPNVPEFLVIDVEPGPGSSAPSSLHYFQTGGFTDPYLAFTAFTAANGSEPYIYNILAETTHLIGDINPGNASSNPAEYLWVEANTILFFRANDGTNGDELFTSSGTAGGNFSLVKNIVAGSGGSSPTNLTLFDYNKVVFSAFTSTEGREPWISDSTEVGTFLLKDIRTGTASSDPSEFVEVNGGRIVFSARDNTNGKEIFVSNGTTLGTDILKDIFTGIGSSSPHNFKANNLKAIFSATSKDNHLELFVTNGTTVGTNILSDINLGKTGSFPSPLGTYQGKELFLISKGLDTFIYSANDTTVTEVAKINASNFTKGSEAHTFAPYSNDGSALFFGRTNNKGREIYKFDANTDTVTLPKELETGSFGFEYVSEMFHFKDDTYLFANFTEELGNELWIYDPVNGGRLLKDINTGTSDSFPRDFIVLNNNVYFTAATSTHGREIWKTDGTTAGTNIFLDLTPGSSGGVLSIHNELFNNKLVFIGGNASTGIELGISDGVSLSPVIIDVKTGFLSSNIYDIGIFNNLIFIAAETNSDGVRLVESNGSTFRIINNADNGSIVYPEYFTATEDMLFFVAENATTGRELYRLNKGGVTPQLVKDIVVGAGSSNINYINKIAENKIVFVAEEGSAGEEFWISDGTTSGTNLIKNLFSNYSSNISQVTNVANKVFFVAEDSTIGTELFVTDGTASGTKVVKDINLGSESSFPQSLKNINGTLFFSAYTNQIGYEPYRVVVDSCPTDGTKLEAGICGCGVVDEDFNSNGVIDCLIQNETKQIIKDLQQAIKKLFIKEVINKKTKKKRKTTLKKLRSQLKEFTSFTKLNKNLINFKKVKKYNKARKEFLKAIRALIKSSNPEDKKLSIKYLKQLRRQIV